MENVLKKIIDEGIRDYAIRLSSEYKIKFKAEFVLEDDESRWIMMVRVKAEGLKTIIPYYSYSYKSKSNLQEAYEGFLTFCVSGNLMLWHDQHIKRAKLGKSDLSVQKSYVDIEISDVAKYPLNDNFKQGE